MRRLLVSLAVFGAVASSAQAIPASVFPRLLWASSAAEANYWPLQLTSWSNGYQTCLSVVGGNPLTIDWGDGGVSNVTGTATNWHTYSAAGPYEVRVSGFATQIKLNINNDSAQRAWTRIGTIAGISGLNSMFYSFVAATNVVYFAPDFLGSMSPSAITDLRYAFSGMKSLTNFPSVAGMTSVSSLVNTWQNSSAIGATFPAVDTLTNVSSLASAWHTTKASSYPAVTNLRSVSDASHAWGWCTYATSFPAVSALTNCTTFTYAWAGCSAATGFPEVAASSNKLNNLSYAWAGTYASNYPEVNALTNVTTILGTWSGCAAAKIFPAVSNLTKVTTIGDTWSGCSACTNFPYVNSLTNATGSPQRMWADCRAATAFPEVSNLTKVAAINEWWWGCWAGTNFPYVNSLTNVTTLSHTWQSCSNCASFPEVSNLTKVGAIYQTWKGNVSGTNFPSIAALTNATRMDMAWQGCTNVFAIPGLPTNAPSLTRCDLMFDGCSNMTGSAQIWWNSTGGVNTTAFPLLSNVANAYRNCKSLSNYGAIPTNWGGTNNVPPYF